MKLNENNLVTYSLKNPKYKEEILKLSHNLNQHEQEILGLKPYKKN